MFTEKFNSIFELLKCSNVDIARRVGCDPSYISHIRTGKRKLNYDGSMLPKLLNHLYEYAEKNQATVLLCNLCSCDILDNPQNIKLHLLHWLCDSDIEADSVKKYTSVEMILPNQHFGEKLSSVMELLNLSNIKLSQRLNVDPSYISRLKNGRRVLKADDQLMLPLCHTLIQCAQDQEKLLELATCTGISIELLQNESCQTDCLMTWFLCNVKDRNTSEVDNLLEYINTFSIKLSEDSLDLNELIADNSMLSSSHSNYESDDLYSCNDVLYWGIDGLRTAVIRFLSDAILNNEKEMWLYSDETTDWITDDKSFNEKWMTLMIGCVQHGIHIKIIHNVDRDISEMFAALENWLPIYMSGMIEPYIPKQRSENRFSHTLFLIPSQEAIYASHVRGTEKEGMYHFSKKSSSKKTDGILSVLQKEYLQLLNNCEPFLQIYTTTNISQYMNDISHQIYLSKNITNLVPSFTIDTLTKDLLDTILLHSNLSSDEISKLTYFWKLRHDTLQQYLSECSLIELVTFPQPDELKNNKIPLNLSTMLPNRQVFCNVAEYTNHIKEMTNLTKKYTNYKVYILPDNPFRFVQIMISENLAILIKSNQPYIVFTFTNKRILHCFKDYLTRLKALSEQKDLTIMEKWKRYLELHKDDT